MDRPAVDARTLAVAALVVVVVAGAAVLLLGDDSVRPVETVPESDAVAVVDGDLVTHPTTHRLANETLARADSDARYDRLLRAVENATGLRPERVQWVAAFARYPNRTTVGTDVGQGYAGVVVRADWRERTLVTSVQDSDIELEERRYRGTAVYRLVRPGPVDVYVAVLAPNTYAVSTRERVVQDAIDVHGGDRPGLSQGLRDALADRRDEAVVRVAARVPTARLEEVAGGAAERATGVDRVGVGYSVFNDTHVGVRATLYAGDESGAEDLQQLLSAGQVVAGSRLDNDTVVAAIDDVEIDRSGAAVTLSYRDDLDGVVTLGDGVAALVGDAVPEWAPLGLSGGASPAVGGAKRASEAAAPAVVTLTPGDREGRTCATC